MICLSCCALLVCLLVPAIPLAKPQCQAEWSRRHGLAAEDCRVCDRRQPQETIYGRLHLCITYVVDCSMHGLELAMRFTQGITPVNSQHVS